MRKKEAIIGIIIFSVFFILNTIADKYTGYIIRRNTAYYEPITWEEYFEGLPILLLFSLIMSIVSVLIYRGAKKSEEKRIEEARKRMKEREQEKDEETKKEKEL